jgi:two-component system, NarL family, nitrate/nitrite response regulator NarL
MIAREQCYGSFVKVHESTIGAQLQISESASKSSLRQLFEKLGVRTRSQLVRVALEQHRDEL